MTTRSDRMLAELPYQYHFSAIMEAIQTAQADELDYQEQKDQDLQNQLYIATATWGLKYWEAPLGIKIVESDSYDIRRSRVLAAWRGLSSQFSTKLIESICEAYSNGDAQVIIDIPSQTVQIKFIGTRGIPPNMNDLKAAVDNVVHAHMGISYSYSYLLWDELDAANKTWDQVDALAMTWDEFEKWGCS